MRNLTFIVAFLFIGWSVSASVNLKPAHNTYTNYNDSFIFIEGGVEFAVYPNGEFDFYFNPDFRRGNSVHISSPNTNISYNSGYNYDPFVQYDDYGAVIQIENVPVYYDYYGRIIQAGNVFLRYNGFGRLAQVGNLHIHYDRHHHYSHYSGFINHYNRSYVYRPWHSYYRRPHVNVSIVFNRPYRAYYQPHRISYNKYVTVYNNYYVQNNGRRNFYRPSERVNSYNYGSRTTSKRELTPVRNNIAYSREDVNRSRSTSDRARSLNTADNSRTRSNLEQNKRSAISRSTNNKVYSERTERSTNSRGSSARAERADIPQQKRQISRERAAQSSNHNSARTIQNRSRSVTPERSSNTRADSFEKSRRSSERNSAVQRPTRQRSSSTRSRSSSGTSRSGEIRSNNSSRSGSSARNMNANS